MKKLPLFIIIISICLLAGYQWGEPVLIHSHPTATINENDMCIEKNGTIHIVWNERYEHNLSQIMYSYSTDEGTTWSIPYNVSQSDTSLLSYPAIASDNNGKLYVAYGWNSLGYEILFVKTYDGSTWSEPARLDSNTYHLNNKFVVDSEDRVYHFWELLGVPYYRYKDLTDTTWSPIIGSLKGFNIEDIIVDKNNNLHGIGRNSINPDVPAYTSYVSYNKLNNLWSDIDVIDSSETITASTGERICLSDDGYLHVASREMEYYWNWKDYYQFKQINDSVWSEPEKVSDYYSYNFSVNDIIVDPEGNVHIFQEYNETPGTIDECIKHDSTWVMDSYIIGEYGSDIGKIIDSNGLLKMVYRGYNTNGTYYLFFIKGLYVGIEEDHSNLAEDCLLHQNYPNPFNPVTQIKFDLAKTSNIKLSVYNINGQLVSELANGVKNAGCHSVDFDGSKLNSGVYYYSLEIDGRAITKKMVLMK